VRTAFNREKSVTAIDRTPGIVFAAAAAAALAWASSVPMTTHDSADAVLRLAWSARPERIERCRRQPDEALAKVPRHMRQELVCEGASAQYRLVVRREGTVIADRVVHGGGLRQDRRLYVFQEFPLAPGEARVHVRFERVEPDGREGRSASRDHARERDEEDGPGDEGQSRRGDEEENRRRAGVVPRELSLTTRVRVGPREVVLVTYDENRQELIVLQQTPTS
jgi:hypothetical protein